MSKKQKRIFWPIVILAALGLGAFAFASNRNVRRTIAAQPVTSQKPTAVANPLSSPNCDGLWNFNRAH